MPEAEDDMGPKPDLPREAENQTDDSASLEQVPELDLAAMIELYGSGCPAHQLLNEWHGPQLWDGSEIVKMRPGDVDRSDGVEKVYQESLMGPEVISAICGGTLAKLRKTMERQGKRTSGMLHDFRTPPLLTKNRRVTGLSVHDQMLQDLVVGETISRAKKSRSRLVTDDHGKAKAKYAGRLLVPRGEQRVLSWATWWESQIQDPDERRIGNDLHVEQIARVIDSLQLDRRIDAVERKRNANRTILFDTLNTSPEVPGGSSLLFTQRVSRWLREGYLFILLYRHKDLRPVDFQLPTSKRERGAGIPQGNNDGSQLFFQARGLKDVGTRPSEYYALRRKGDDTIAHIHPVEGWMVGDLREVNENCQEIDKAHRKKYDWSV